MLHSPHSHCCAQAPPGAFQAERWPGDAPEFAPRTPGRTASRKRLRLDGFFADPSKGGESDGGSLDWRLRVAEVKGLVDQGLRSALSGALLVLKEQVSRESFKKAYQMLT